MSEEFSEMKMKDKLIALKITQILLKNDLPLKLVSLASLIGESTEDTRTTIGQMPKKAKVFVSGNYVYDAPQARIKIADVFTVNITNGRLLVMKEGVPVYPNEGLLERLVAAIEQTKSEISHIDDIEHDGLLRIKEERGRELINLKLPRNITSKMTYIMADTSCMLYKIGQSKTPTKREKTMLAQSSQIKVIAVSKFLMEKELHRQFKHCRIRGEWFQLSESELSDCLSWMKAGKIPPERVVETAFDPKKLKYYKQKYQ